MLCDPEGLDHFLCPHIVSKRKRNIQEKSSISLCHSIRYWFFFFFFWWRVVGGTMNAGGGVPADSKSSRTPGRPGGDTKTQGGTPKGDSMTTWEVSLCTVRLSCSGFDPLLLVIELNPPLSFHTSSSSTFLLWWKCPTFRHLQFISHLAWVSDTKRRILLWGQWMWRCIDVYSEESGRNWYVRKAANMYD